MQGAKTSPKTDSSLEIVFTKSWKFKAKQLLKVGIAMAQELQHDKRRSPNCNTSMPSTTSVLLDVALLPSGPR